jgi:hypothetical protein
VNARVMWLPLTVAVTLAATTALTIGTLPEKVQSAPAILLKSRTVIGFTDSLTHTTFLPLIARSYPDPLTRLENGGYGDLATQLRALPEITDGITVTDTEALEDIATLALSSASLTWILHRCRRTILTPRPRSLPLKGSKRA